MFIRQTDTTFVTSEITIMPMPAYQNNATYLCINTVFQKTVLECFCLTHGTKLRYRRDTLERLRMLRTEHYRHKVTQAMKERSQD